MRHAAWVLAYHGCDKEIGEAILSQRQEIIPSANDYVWLGTGAYFWENSYSRALAWAEFLKKNPGISKTRIKEPFVVGAIIDPGDCLDLSENSSLEVLKAAFLEFEFVFKSLDFELPENEPSGPGDPDLVKRKLDCAVINFLHTIREVEGKAPFDTVRSPFMEGAPLFPGAGIHSKTHIQWCIREPKKNVFAYFRPRLPLSA